MASDSELHTFLNRIRILYCVDHDVMERALKDEGVTLSSDKWNLFRTNPYEFLIRADDTTARAIWGIIEVQESRRAR